ncbi:hypothetical protein C5167_045621 [Papaver somniferum]|uniref:Homogentisate phytyltransferase n=1 Tax=Papaver somniferum TaxID=3469 RepID=A0A4Y7LBI0_PAPSO|nr:hypothetical protein C5167_045621 [Papaver somniferum]
MDICLSSPSSCSFRVSAVKLLSSRTKSNRTKFPIKPTESHSQSLLNSSKNYSSTFGLSKCTSCSSRGVSHRHSRRFSIWDETNWNGDNAQIKTNTKLIWVHLELDAGQGCSGVEASGSDPGALHKVSEFKDAIWRFLRPHTIRGTALGSFALVSKALIENPNLIKWSLVTKALCGLFALICGNGYIVGINQIYDIGIDKVNKPYLPIAAGEHIFRSSIEVEEISCCSISHHCHSKFIFVITFYHKSVVFVLLLFHLFQASANMFYGFNCFKNHFLFRANKTQKRKVLIVHRLYMLLRVRGFLLNFGVYYATKVALGLAFEWSSPVAFITTFVTVFALVIAITKDLPDVEGDRKFQISTFATKLGVRNIALLGSGLLLVNYIGAIFAAIYFPQAFRSRLMIPLHAVLAMGLIFQVFSWLSKVPSFPSLPYESMKYIQSTAANPLKVQSLLISCFEARSPAKRAPDSIMRASCYLLRDGVDYIIHWTSSIVIGLLSLFLILSQTWMLEQANYTKDAISGYYRFVWNLFYSEYIIFPFI